MMIKIAACLLAVTFLASCETTKTTQRTTLREMYSARLASNDTSSNLNEPAPPAEGPETAPPERLMDPVKNPALVPSPLLRSNAAGSP
jgi:hypothetical protein